MNPLLLVIMIVFGIAAILTVMSYGIFIYGLQLTIPLWPAL